MRKLFTLLLLALSIAVHGKITLPKIFGSNMILQRDRAIQVWGWSDAAETVVIRFHNQSKSTKADKSGHWKIQLDAEQAGGPFDLIVRGENTITLQNVLIGDVWLCAGQSNMEWRVQDSNNAKTEIQNGNYPEIRHFKIPNTISGHEESDIKGGEWRVCSAETVGDFTAVGYFFARDVFEQTHIPIGLINSSWGGTHIETWTSREAFEGSEEYKDMIATMPVLNIDSLYRQKSIENKQIIRRIQGNVVSSDEAMHWKESLFKDDLWPEMNAPELWGNDLKNIDGVVWFRKDFVITKEETNADALLALGPIDDSDETFVNGVKIGSTQNNHQIKRAYPIPKGILKAGRNNIAIRVEDTGGGGGMYGQPDEFKIVIGPSTRSLSGKWKFQIETISPSLSLWANSFPTLLFNAMISPITPFAIQGVLWYQGESNNTRAYQYIKALPLLINDWRKHWGQGNFPFFYVQLANYNANNGTSAVGSTWAELREAQSLALSIPNTGLAVTTDIGDPKDVHPRNKQDIGKRLAAIALHHVYGKSIMSGGPSYLSMTIEGDQVRVFFKDVGKGFLVKDRYGYIRGFEIAGADKIFYYAKAFVEKDHITVYQENVKKPIAIRYGWCDETTELNLFNQDGFPAMPFRTDQWKGITVDAEYVIGQ